MKKILVNARLCEAAAEKFGKAKNKQEFIEALLSQEPGLCSVCGKPWPTKTPATKPNIAVRVDSDLIAKLSGVSKYISSKINVGLGLCPLCDQSVS